MNIISFFLNTCCQVCFVDTKRPKFDKKNFESFFKIENKRQSINLDFSCVFLFFVNVSKYSKIRRKK